MSERLKVRTSKVCVQAIVPWVQIPLPPFLCFNSYMVGKAVRVEKFCSYSLTGHLG